MNLSPNASWRQDAITVAGWANGTSESLPSQLNKPIGIDISRNDILYISDINDNRVVVVCLNYTNSSYAIDSAPNSDSGNFLKPHSVFVTKSSLYVTDSGNQRIQKLSLDSSNPTTALQLNETYSLTYLYVDINDNIYLSDTTHHRVLLFHSNLTSETLVAGTGVNGSDDTQLNQPYGVFVNQIGTIYIADCQNHRIMKWLPGASSGIRVAGTGIAGASLTQLNLPTHIIVDTNEYMYISESGNVRITRWSPNSTYGVCIAACTGTSGIASNQLNRPHSLAFDNNGSLYISDLFNNRVQKFEILNYHGKYSIYQQ